LLGGVLAGALAGCSLVPSTAPTPATSPTGDLLPGQRATLALREALEAAAAAQQEPAQARVLAWALSVSDDHLAAISLPAASPRATATPTAVATPSAAAEALRAAATAFAAQAQVGDVARPLVWASMSAWARTLAGHLGDTQPSLEPARTLLAPAAQSAAEAIQSALGAASETIYGLEVAAGAPGLSSADAAALREQRAAWMTVRDDLTETGASASPAPTPGAPWYAVERVTDAAAARALAARLHTAALPVLGRSLAHGDAALRAALATQIDASATALVGWGGLMQRWPGLPLA